MTPEDLNRRRQALGMSQTELAAYLGVSYWTYRNWETGRRVPRGAQASLTAWKLDLAEDAVRNGARLPDWRYILGSLGRRAV